ncbi:hypothetical protein KKA33_00895 [Patescibacteria group bacterium]|nr:hypothetical protein [Patescibacteria group bacterium]
MPIPSEQPATATPEAEQPLEDTLDDFVDAAEQFKQAILQIKSLDKDERAKVEKFILENRVTAEGFLSSLEPDSGSAEN